MDKDAGELAGSLIRLGRVTATASEASVIESCLLDVVLDSAVVGAAAAALLVPDAAGVWRPRLTRGLPPALASWSLAEAPADAGLGSSLEQAWVAEEPLTGDGRRRDVRQVQTLILSTPPPVQRLLGALVMFAAPGATITPAQNALAAALVQWVGEALHRLMSASGSSAGPPPSGDETAGLAAELEEVLAPLALQTEMLRRRLQGQPSALEIVEFMEQSLLQAGALVARLRPT